MTYYIGADIGTSGTKTVLFDVSGNVVASASEEYPLYQPQNGYAEQQPQDWANAVLHTIAAVVKQSGVDPQDVKGIGLSGQMHGLVMLDQANQVIRPAIIWCDQRTAAECEEITERVREIIAQTGAASPSDRGKVMGVASKQMAGLADGRTLSGIVRELLARG